MEGTMSKIPLREEKSPQQKIIESCIRQNKQGTERKYRLEANECFGEYLNEPEIEEMPRIIELPVSSFYEGDAAKDSKYRPTNIRGEEKKKVKGKLVDMNQIFEPPEACKNTENQPDRGMRSTLTGPAGSGKTTMLSRIAREATEGNVDQMKQFIVHQVNCRELDPKEKISVAEFLFKIMLCEQKLSKEDMEFGYRWMQENSAKLALIIDSLDTMRFQLEDVDQVVGPNDVATPDAILHNLLTGNLFRKSLVLTSSREFKIKGYKGALRPDKIVSLAGLTKKSIRNLTMGFVGKEEGEQILKMLDNCPGLKELCETPVFLLFTIIAFKAKEGASAFTAKSMTGILVNVINCLSRSKHARTREHLSKEEFIAAINKMKVLAYNGMMDDKVLYSKEDLIRANLSVREVSDLTMIVPGKVEKLQQILESGDVSFFIHQLLGELFCALKICEEELESFRQFASEDIHEGKYAAIRLLMCGSLLDDEVFKEASGLLLQGKLDFKEKKEILRESLKNRFNELVKGDESRDLLDLIHAIHESGDGGVGIVPSTIDKISMWKVPLTASDTFALGGSIFHSSHLNNLDLRCCNLSSESVQTLDNKLQDSNLKVTELNVAGNDNLGVKGLFSVGCLVSRHGVDKLSICGCKLKREEVDSLDSGLGDAKDRCGQFDCFSGGHRSL